MDAGGSTRSGESSQAIANPTTNTNITIVTDRPGPDKLIELPESFPAKRNVVVEQLASRGSINLRELGDYPYDEHNDPDSFNERAVIYLSLPSLNQIQSSKRHRQIPAVCFCLPSELDIIRDSLLDSTQEEKLKTVLISQFYESDKQKIVERARPMLRSGFLAGITLPIRLFESDNKRQRNRRVYDAMINSLVLPVLRLHSKIEFTSLNLKLMPLGDSTTQDKLSGVISGRYKSLDTTIDVQPIDEADSSGIVELMQLISWCVGNDANNRTERWLSILNDGK